MCKEFTFCLQNQLFVLAFWLYQFHEKRFLSEIKIFFDIFDLGHPALCS